MIVDYESVKKFKEEALCPHPYYTMHSTSRESNTYQQYIQMTQSSSGQKWMAESNALTASVNTLHSIEGFESIIDQYEAR